MRPSNLAVVDLAPWWTIWERSRSLTKPANGDGCPMLVSLPDHLLAPLVETGISPKKVYLP